MTIKKFFSSDDIERFAPSEKVGIVATVTPEGLPHMTLLTSIMASRPDQIIIGEFCTGRSKEYMQEIRKIAFAILTLDRRLWLGKARWTYLMKEGPEYEVYNRQPMFRYNTYFGINTVHYCDLIETTEGEPLPMARIVKSALLTQFAAGAAGTGKDERVLSYFGENLFNTMGSLKFLSLIGSGGFPVIIPLVQCRAADSARLVFHPGASGDDLKKIEPGTTVSIFCLTMQMEDVLVRGTFAGFDRYRGVNLGVVDINWIYNSMPPNHGQIYPEIPLRAVTHF